MKKSTKILFFAILLGLAACASDTSNQNGSHGTESHQDCTKRVMEMDSALGGIRNHACERLSLSETIRAYLKPFDTADFSSCPADFTAAFRKHLQAWEGMIAVTDHFPDKRGEMHDLFDEIEKSEKANEFKSRLKAIWDTWAEVEAAIPATVTDE